MDALDFRSDTLTKPNDDMRRAMASAVVGDDVFGEDPTVQQLEAHVASLSGKEMGLFVPSGTMGNLLAVLAHCDHRMSEVIAGDKAHQILYEVGNLSGVGGIHTRQIPTQEDGTLPLALIEAAIRRPDSHVPHTRAVLLENTHNLCGGRVLPVAYCEQVRQLCHSRGLALHCDGARLWNAAVAQGASLKDVAKPFDTISLCLSKGLGAPLGSIVVGPAKFIRTCRHLRKMLGGGMRQVGIVAAAGLYAVNTMYPRLKEDHVMASTMGTILSRGGVAVLKVESNIVIWRVPGSQADAVATACKAQGILIISMGPGLCRAIPHFGNSLADAERAANVIVGVMGKLLKGSNL